jgi:hypothetical protein
VLAQLSSLLLQGFLFNKALFVWSPVTPVEVTQEAYNFSLVLLNLALLRGLRSKRS